MTDDTISKLNSLIRSRALSDSQAAQLLGVPVFTLRKWRTGTRKPTASAVRLIEIMSLLSVIAPNIVDSMSSSY